MEASSSHLPHPDHRRASIDHALDLEHQLNEEDSEYGARPTSAEVAPSSLDPDVLASIVIQQRNSLADLTHERDELSGALAKAHIVQSELQSHMSELSDLLEHEQQRSATLEVDLKEAREKAANDAESITMLRSKVEESRRGVMRLQSERETRRMSQFQPLQLDLSSASTTSGGGRTPGFSTFSKRASVISTGGSTPRSPTFLGHRRVSSMSDPGLTPDSSDTASSSFPPVIIHTPSEPGTSTSAGRRKSLSPSPVLSPLPPTFPPLISEDELASLKNELKSLRRELAQTKEAKEASDIVLRALREMIGVDPESTELPDPEAVKSLKGLSLPPLPTDEMDDEDEDEPAGPPVEEKKTGWGIKLWRTSAAQAPKAASPEPLPKSDSGSDAFVHSSNRSSASSGPNAELPSLTRTTSASSSSSPPVPPKQAIFKKFSLFASPAPPPVPEKENVPIPEEVPEPNAEETHAEQHAPELEVQAPTPV